MKRLRTGGAIDRATRIPFTWDGRPFTGYQGDTLASALLANNVRVLARSFKYHRPRGLAAAWTEEPNAIVDLVWHDHNGAERHDPNARATLIALTPGMAAKGINAWPNVRHDAAGLLDLAHRFLPAGFYYKTFMAPRWERYEPRIRRMAGLGTVRETVDPLHYEATHASCDILIVGAGPAGLAAARAAAGNGLKILLADDRATPGGSLLWTQATIDNQPADNWAAAPIEGVTLFPNTTAFGYFDHNAVALLQRRPPAPGWAEERLIHVRARQVILATGAIERPLVFPNNDRPGVMLAGSVLQYLRQYAVLAGEHVLIATNNDSAYETARALQQAGAQVTIADARPSPPQSDGIMTHPGSTVIDTGGRHGVRWADIAPLGRPTARTRLAVDLVATSGGWSPAVHLFSQSGGKLRWNETQAAFLPVTARPNQHLAGAPDLAEALATGHIAGQAAASALGRTSTRPAPATEPAPPETPIRPLWQIPTATARQWIDFQNDVTTQDVALAARENYASVEHLKRYTTLGMATDQGKTSNINGLAILAHATGRSIAEVGTTTFRPPFIPVSFAAIAGLRHGPLAAPIRRLPAHADHVALGADMREYGGWFRPACYPNIGETIPQAIQREAIAARASAGLLDGSSLGKIEVQGRDAAEFLNLIYYNEVANLKPGRIRYCLLLRETGIVYDDGVVARLAPDRYLLSPSSSHTQGVLALLELWHQTEYPKLEVAFHDITAAWATFAISGPASRTILAQLDTGIDLADQALPHMALAEGTLGGRPARLARVSFTGERSYELSVPASQGTALWRRLLAMGATPFGIETLSILRAEKGYLLIGTDTDGTTLPQDLGITAPIRNKKVDFVGKRSLFTEDAQRPDRRQFVGLLPENPAAVPAVGTHAVENQHSLGWITTACYSPAAGRSIALGMIQAGRARAGAEIELYHLGQTSRARITDPVFLDPMGARLHA